MIVPYEAFPTADGQVMIAAGTDELFHRTCRAIGVPELGDDPRVAHNPDRVHRRRELFDALARATRALPTDDAIRRLQDAGVPCAPPLLGQHTEEVLRAFGFGSEEIAGIEECGAIERGRPE